MKIGAVILATLAASAAASVAQAQDAGTWIFRSGVHSIQPKSDNNEAVNVDSAAMLTFNGTYMFKPNWGVEVLAALPFEHDINLNGGGEVASTKHLPPTVSLQYHFLPNGAIRPYVGVGLNATIFFSEETTGALDGAELELEESFGPAVQAGLDVAFANDWFVNVDVRWFDIDTDAKVRVGADTVDLGTVEIDPYAFGVSLGKRF